MSGHQFYSRDEARFIASAQLTAQRLLHRDGEAHPTLLIKRGSRFSVCTVPMVDKEATSNALRRVVQKAQPDMYIFISEAWTLDQDKVSPEETLAYYQSGQSLAEHPHRVEVIQLFVGNQRDTSRGRLITVAIDRPKHGNPRAGRTVADHEQSGQAWDAQVGRFANLYDTRPLQSLSSTGKRKMEKLATKMLKQAKALSSSEISDAETERWLSTETETETVEQDNPLDRQDRPNADIPDL